MFWIRHKCLIFVFRNEMEERSLDLEAASDASDEESDKDSDEESWNQFALDSWIFDWV